VSVYLVEPRWASSAILKFSGTLGMSHHSDRWSATITAFSHFVLENSACGYMFADIQCMSVFKCLSPCPSCVCRINGSTQSCAKWVSPHALQPYDPHSSRVSQIAGKLSLFTSNFENISALFIVILDSATMVPKASKTSSLPTSAPAFVVQWTCAQCLTYRLQCRTGSIQVQTLVWRTLFNFTTYISF